MGLWILGSCAKQELPELVEEGRPGSRSPIMVISQITRTENGRVSTDRYQYSKGQLVSYVTRLGYQYTVKHEPENRRFLVRGPLGLGNKEVHYYYDLKGNITRVMTAEDGKQANTWYTYNHFGQVYEQSLWIVPGTDNTRQMFKRFLYRGLWLNTVLQVEKTYKDQKVVAEKIVEVLDSVAYRGPFYVRHSTSDGYRVNEYHYSNTLLDPYYHNPFTVYTALPCYYPIKAEFLFPKGFNYPLGTANFSRFYYGVGMFVRESRMVLNDYINGQILPYTIINKVENLKQNEFNLPVEYDEVMTHIDNFGEVSTSTTHYAISYVNLRETF